MAKILGLDLVDGVLYGALIKTSMRKIESVRCARTPLAVVEARPTERMLPSPTSPVSVETNGDETSDAHDSDDAAATAYENAQHAALATAVETLHAEFGEHIDRTYVAIDGNAVSLREISLPPGVAKRIGEVLPFELENQLPYDMGQSVVHQQLVSRSDESYDVMACALPRERVQAEIDKWQRADVDPYEIAAGPAALDGLAVWLGEVFESTQVVALININEEESDVCVLVDGRCTFAQTVDGGVSDLRARNNQALLAPLKRSLLSYAVQDNPAVERVILMGRAALTDGAAAWLGAELNAPCEVLYAPGLSSIHPDELPLYGKALALAARGADRKTRMNLRQGDLAPIAQTTSLKRYLPLALACALAITLSFLFSIIVRYTVISSEQEQLSAELEGLTERVFGDKVSSAAAAAELLSGGKQVEDPLPRFDAYDALSTVINSIPEGMTHDARRLVVELNDESREGSFELQGTVASISERDTIAQALEGHRCIPKIDKGSTAAGPQGEGLTYRLEGEIACPDERISSSKKKKKRKGKS